MKPISVVAPCVTRCSIILLGMSGLISACSALAVPPQTAIPVEFTKTINAGKVRVGEAVNAKTMQVVILPGGGVIPKGSLLTGHVTEAIPFHFDRTDYAVQKPSMLGIRFDTLVIRGETTPIAVKVRALANALDARDAVTPHGLDESDSLGTMILVGGSHFSPVSKTILSPNDDIVGYNRKGGTFAHLLPSCYADQTSGFQCSGTTTEQSIAIFSPDACGLYGFDTVTLSQASLDSTFGLESRKHTVTLYAGSAAVFQVQ